MEAEMAEELEVELDKLKKDKIVSEETAAVYLSRVRKLLEDDSSEDYSKKD
jgi:hypothetical protein